VASSLPPPKAVRPGIKSPTVTWRALEAVVDVVLAVDDGATCADDNCTDLLCCVSP